MYRWLKERPRWRGSVLLLLLLQSGCAPERGEAKSRRSLTGQWLGGVMRRSISCVVRHSILPWVVRSGNTTRGGLHADCLNVLVSPVASNIPYHK